MSTPIFAQGTKFKMGDGGTPEEFTTIARVRDFPFPDTQRDLIEVTDHDSPDGREEFIAGLVRSGELTFQVAYVPQNATHQAFIAAVEAGVVRNFQIEMVDDDPGTLWEFAGIPRRFQPTAPVNGEYRADLAVKVTGAVEITVAT